MKILLIDDTDEINDAVEGYLIARFHADVTCEPTGPTGKQAGDDDLNPPWDAIAIDRQLFFDQGTGVAYGDGLVLAAIFRKDLNYAQTPIIVYSRTKWMDEKDHPEAYVSSGIFICVLTEPIDVAVIGDLVAAHVGKGPWTWLLDSRHQ